MSKQINSSKDTGLKFYYDEELFNDTWATEPDPILTVLIDSGAVVVDPEIERMISGGGNYYTIPFYKDLEGDTQKYDGLTDLEIKFTEDDKQSGIVYSEWVGFGDRDFVKDFTGADPMSNIVRRITKYWAKKHQEKLISILKGIFAITGDDEWAKHTTDISTKTDSVADENRIGLTTIRNATVKALGDHANNIAMAIMHSTVANTLENLQVLNYYTATYNGMVLDVTVAKSGNVNVLIFDGVPVKTSTTATGEFEYTTYLLGYGSILTANAPVEKPSELMRKADVKGGTDVLITRVRRTYHPNGFNFSMSAIPITPTNAELETGTNWTRKMLSKNINIVRLITNG